MLGALLSGVPQVVVPLFADQPYNARRIAALGAGLAADAEGPEAMRAAVERLLDESVLPRRRGPGRARGARLPPIDSVPSVVEALALRARAARGVGPTAVTPSRASSASARARWSPSAHGAPIARSRR